MLVRNIDFRKEQEKSENGLGNFTMRQVFNDKTLPAHVRLMCEVLINPGEECRLHPHIGDTEIYYILSGKAEYEGAEGKSVLEPGDVTCCYDGESHAIKCRDSEPLKFLAFITCTK
jgi:mannose-6-phosphate isomerase-like protein (cupin superfamily)